MEIPFLSKPHQFVRLHPETCNAPLDLLAPLSGKIVLLTRVYFAGYRVYTPEEHKKRKKGEYTTNGKIEVMLLDTSAPSGRRIFHAHARKFEKVPKDKTTEDLWHQFEALFKTDLTHFDTHYELVEGTPEDPFLKKWPPTSPAPSPATPGTPPPTSAPGAMAQVMTETPPVNAVAQTHV